jgi:hypothetical protein
MVNYPITLIDAQKYRYGCYAGNPCGTKHQKGRCAYEIRKNWSEYQCYNKAVAGPEGLYCKMHAKIVLEKNVDEK